MKEYILTFDLGTTGNKCMLIDWKSGEMQAVVVPYETQYPHDGWAEQWPEDFWSSVVTGTRCLLEKTKVRADQIAALALCGHMNGCILVDENGTALTPNIIHSDSRAIKECEYLKAVVGDEPFYAITGNRIDPHYSLPKVLWCRTHYPEAYKKSAYIINTKDYVYTCLTGCVGVTDYSDAGLTIMMDLTKREWAWDMLRDIDVDGAKMPQLRKSHDMSGRLTAQAAAVLGLREGTPVALGGGDGACAAHGAGVARAGESYANIGSSAWIGILSEGMRCDPAMRNSHFGDLSGELLQLCAVVQCAGSAFDWSARTLYGTDMELEKENERPPFVLLEKEAEKIAPGSDGVYFLPYLMGERAPHWDANTRGAYIGFMLPHTRAHLLRATYEGISYALHNIMDLHRDTGAAVRDLRLIGGGANSVLWNRILSSVLNVPLHVHTHLKEATSLGAAMAAGVGLGIFRDYTEAAKLVTYARHISPDPDAVRAYDTRYKTFCRMYPQLKPIYDAIAAQETV